MDSWERSEINEVRLAIDRPGRQIALRKSLSSLKYANEESPFEEVLLDDATQGTREFEKGRLEIID